MSLKHSVFFASLAAGAVMATTALAGLPTGHSPNADLIAGLLKPGAKPAPLPPVVAAGAIPSSATVAVASSNVADANASATDVVATTGTCEAYFTKSQSLSPVLQSAFPAMSSKDTGAMAAVLPTLQAQLNSLPSTEIRAEVCGGNHINAYSTAQYTDLNVLLLHGYPTGLTAGLPVIKQPELNHAAVAYATGWIKYEQGDFNGALAAYGKGLAMFPYNHELQNEYLATLLQLRDGASAVSFSERVLSTTFDLDDTTRAKLFFARGVGLVFLNRLPEANDSLTISLRYNYTADAAAVQKQVMDSMPK